MLVYVLTRACGSFPESFAVGFRNLWQFLLSDLFRFVEGLIMNVKSLNK